MATSTAPKRAVGDRRDRPRVLGEHAGDLEAVRRRQRLDELPHASVTDDSSDAHQRQAITGSREEALVQRGRSAARQVALRESRSVIFRRAAACDTMRSGMSPSASSTRRRASGRAAGRRRPRRRSPSSSSRVTSANADSAAMIAGSRRGSSTVTETLTSEVVTTSTEVREALEHLEEPAQEAVRHQHARRRDVDDRDALLRRDRGERPIGRRAARAVISVPRRLRRDASSGCGRECSARRRAESWPGAAPWRRSTPAPTPRRTTGAARPADVSTMRGSAVSMPSTSVQIWISLRAEAGADDRGGVVRAAAAERRRDAVARGADEAAEHRNAPRGERRIGVRHSAAVVSGNSGAAAVCSPSVTIGLRASTHGGGSPCDVERRGDDAAAEDLAGRGDARRASAANLAQHARARHDAARARRTRG